ncbi:uncharacterized protein PG998_011157, partial [Apiospora kogelbergensis]
SIRRSSQQLLNPAVAPAHKPSPLPISATATSTSTSSAQAYRLLTARTYCQYTDQPTQSRFKHRIANQTAKMSTMPAQGGHSQACCNIPPVVSKGYQDKGSYEDVGGFKTYVTGPKDASKGVLIIYDIFGYFPQTLQGADILSSSDDHQKYKVVMPDWFKGEPCPIEWFPPTTEEKQKKLGGFFEKFPPPSVAGKVPAYMKAAKEKFPEVREWAILGHCWGGKVVSLVVSAPDNTFKAGVECHPAMVEPEDAKKIKVPLCMLASKDEDVEDVKKFEANLTGAAKHVETFGDQIHGWMAARSDLEDGRVKEEYIRGYETVLKFLSKNM